MRRVSGEALLIYTVLTVVLWAPVVLMLAYFDRDVLALVALAIYVWLAAKIWVGIVWRRTWT
jgi:hypothetical protein